MSLQEKALRESSEMEHHVTLHTKKIEEQIAQLAQQKEEAVSSEDFPKASGSIP